MADEESIRQRKLRQAVEDLPEPFSTARDRGPSTALGRHLDALRYRLNNLVRLEELEGEAQRSLHRNRAERNALIFVLQQLAPTALEQAEKSFSAPTPRRPGPNYVSSMLEEIGDLADLGYTRIERKRPGQIFHRSGTDIAPLTISNRSWVYLLGRSSATEDGREARDP